jgi:hypothetical protein
MTFRVPNSVQEVLDEVTEAGLQYTIEDGGKHYKVRVAGKLAAILPKGKALKEERHRRILLNTRAQVRRVINEVRT